MQACVWPGRERAGRAGAAPSPGSSLRHSTAPPLRSLTRYSERFTERNLPFTAPSHVSNYLIAPYCVVK